MKIAFAEYAIPKGGVVVAGVMDDKSLSPGAAELDRRTGGADTGRLVEEFEADVDVAPARIRQMEEGRLHGEPRDRRVVAAAAQAHGGGQGEERGRPEG